MTNRKMRRKVNKVSKMEGKKLILKGWNNFENVTMEAIRKCELLQGIKPQGLVAVWKNNIYVVQIFDYWLSDSNGSKYGKKLMIRRNDAEPCHNWNAFQRIKNELCGEDSVAVEVYPRQNNLIDEANMYWLWVYPSSVECPFEVMKIS